MTQGPDEELLFTGAAVLDAVALVEKTERERWAKMLRDEADEIEENLGGEWSPSEVAQELRDMANKIDRGGVL